MGSLLFRTLVQKVLHNCVYEWVVHVQGAVRAAVLMVAGPGVGRGESWSFLGV
jgi:hypothetical protein